MLSGWRWMEQRNRRGNKAQILAPRGRRDQNDGCPSRPIGLPCMSPTARHRATWRRFGKRRAAHSPSGGLCSVRPAPPCHPHTVHYAVRAPQHRALCTRGVWGVSVVPFPLRTRRAATDQHGIRGDGPLWGRARQRGARQGGGGRRYGMVWYALRYREWLAGRSLTLPVFRAGVRGQLAVTLGCCPPGSGGGGVLLLRSPPARPPVLLPPVLARSPWSLCSASLSHPCPKTHALVRRTGSAA